MNEPRTESSARAAELSDEQYLLALIDPTFENVPEVRAHHDRMKAIAARVAALQEAVIDLCAAMRLNDLTDDELRQVLDVSELAPYDHAKASALLKARRALSPSPIEKGTT